MTDSKTPASEVAALQPSPKGLGVLKAAFRERRTLAMLLLGFSAGLPFAMLFGTLNAWLSDAGVSVATIGVLSWVGLFGAFKFLWSPAVGLTPPLIGRMGRRRCADSTRSALFVTAQGPGWAFEYSPRQGGCRAARPLIRALLSGALRDGAPRKKRNGGRSPRQASPIPTLRPGGAGACAQSHPAPQDRRASTRSCRVPARRSPGR